MSDVTFTAYLFSALIAVVMAFQFLLALAAPWGEMAMGGRFPGRFPPVMRLVALVQILLLAFSAAIVLVRAGVIYNNYAEFAKSAIWAVVVFCLIATILNTITPSKRERQLWAPVSLVLLICSTYVAVSA